MQSVYTYSLAIFAVAMVVGCVPLFFRWSDRVLHLLVTFSCGIFLGAVFLHLLPGVAELSTGMDNLFAFVLLGVVGVYTLETIFVRQTHPAHDHHHHHHHAVSAGPDPTDQRQHAMVSYVALLGLGIHSVAEGLGLAAVLRDDHLAGALFLGIVSHKGAGALTLATVFKLAAFSSRKITALITGFALITPLSILGGKMLVGSLGPEAQAVLTALAAGTFLFVALCELLPEVLHRPADRLLKVLLLLGGIGLIHLIHIFQEHDHAH